MIDLLRLMSKGTHLPIFVDEPKSVDLSPCALAAENC
jgi:hypothetical protein